jgi:hypothetical protein
VKCEETEIINLVLAQILRKLNFVVLKYVSNFIGRKNDDRVKKTVVFKYLEVDGSGQ